MSSAGANLGALCSFLLARTFLREKVVAGQRHPKFRFLDQAIGKQGFKSFCSRRLSPVFPFVLLNYFLGLTAVRTGAYALANLLGMLPAIPLRLFRRGGADALAGHAAAQSDFYQQILKYLGLLATVAVVVIVTRIARKALREAEQQHEGSVATVNRARMQIIRPIVLSRRCCSIDPHDKQLIDNCHPPRKERIRRRRKNTIWS